MSFGGGTLRTGASGEDVDDGAGGGEDVNGGHDGGVLAFCATLRRAKYGALLRHCLHAWTARSCAVWAADRKAALTSSSLANESARSTMVVMPMSART